MSAGAAASKAHFNDFSAALETNTSELRERIESHAESSKEGLGMPKEKRAPHHPQKSPILQTPRSCGSGSRATPSMPRITHERALYHP